MLDLRHLDGLPILCAGSRRIGWQLARDAGLRPRDVHHAITAIALGWVIGRRVGDLRHWALLADTETMIVVPGSGEPVPAETLPQHIDSGWRLRHRGCEICDWNHGIGYRRLTPAAWHRRTTALLPHARDGADYIPAVRDHLVVALRMHQTGRFNDAAFWLSRAEQAATPGNRRRRTARPARRH